MLHRRLATLTLTALIATAGWACGGDDPAGSGGGGAGGSGDTGGGGNGSIEPLDGPDGEWAFLEVEGMICGNGSPTGVGFRRAAASNELLIFLQGGGACYNADNCLGDMPAAAHFDGFGQAEFDAIVDGPLSTGAFARDDAANPFKDMNVVFVPYCTGDVHIGNSIKNDLHFVGQENVKAALERIVATFPSPDRFVFAGESAGGFGVMYNYWLVADAYPGVEGFLVDDSGPYFPWLQAAALGFLKATYKMEDTVAPDCALCLDQSTPEGGLHQLIPYYAERYPGMRGSLLSSYQDEVIRERFLLAPDKYEELLNALADDTVSQNPDFRVYYLQGEHHVWLNGPENGTTLGDVTSDGVGLGDFLEQQLSGDGQWADVRPPSSPTP